MTSVGISTEDYSDVARGLYIRFCLFCLHVSRKLFQILLGLFLLVGNKDKCRHSRFICSVFSMVEDHAKLDSPAQGNCRWLESCNDADSKDELQCDL
jgi:hypothetical protein